MRPVGIKALKLMSELSKKGMLKKAKNTRSFFSSLKDIPDSPKGVDAMAVLKDLRQDRF